MTDLAPLLNLSYAINKKQISLIKLKIITMRKKKSTLLRKCTLLLVCCLLSAFSAFAEVDKTVLINNIANAQALYDGADDTQYRTGAVDVLQIAISAAELVNGDAAASQVQVDAAVNSMKTAISTFNASSLILELAGAVIDKPLNTVNVSGQYLVEASGMFLNINGNQASASAEARFVINFIKGSGKDSTYIIQCGKNIATYADVTTNNLVFKVGATSSIKWKVKVVSGDTVTIQRNTDDGYVNLNADNFFYTKGGSTDVVKIVLHTVITKTAVTPVEHDYSAATKQALNAADLSGRYVIQTSDLANYMSPIIATSLPDPTAMALPEAKYAFDLIKTEDGTYNIKCGDLFAMYQVTNNWFLEFQPFATEKNTWNITVLAGDTITIQRSSDSKYLKFEPNGGDIKFYTDAGADKEIRYFLLKVDEDLKPVLQAAVDNAQALYDGSKDADFKPGAKPTLLSAIAAAKAVLDNAAATSAQIESATNVLNNAVGSFTASSLTRVINAAFASVQVFPNPTSNYLNVKNASGVSSISVYNVQGQQIMQMRNSNSDLVIPVSAWSKGLYILKMSGLTGNQKTMKFEVK